ncbi:hypothetical protein DNTS_004909 [Danionella cerebrum]|uniref:Carboxypeptidase B n=1 Tax=Danionella cerebrum TaxID=2873325 RepID=A0A553MZ86_9TELE|nr:hypothetical protein DNTS_004909 [Danionella translucida]
MKLLILLGLMAVALCEPKSFVGDKVLRLTPENEVQVKIVRQLSQKFKCDFWKPDSAELVSIGMNVDIHVPVAQLSMVFRLLQQSGVKVRVMFENLQEALESQMENKRMALSHNYTKYNNWATISQWIISIGSSNPELISRQVIGSSYEGRPLHLLKIGKKRRFDKPAIFMDCGFHAREWISPAFCQWFVKEVQSIKTTYVFQRIT